MKLFTKSRVTDIEHKLMVPKKRGGINYEFGINTYTWLFAITYKIKESERELYIYTHMSMCFYMYACGYIYLYIYESVYICVYIYMNHFAVYPKHNIVN